MVGREGIDERGGAMRAWQYWTENKLQILRDYVPAFNTASKRSTDRLYFDLMAGEPMNVSAVTGAHIDGSARIAMDAEPGFTRLFFGEKDARRETELRQDLTARYPGDDRWKLYQGDSNVTVHQMLADASPWRWAPTFAFVDQQAAESTWGTLTALAGFRKGQIKAELWVLTSPAMIARGVKGTRGSEFEARVTAFYGTEDWKRIAAARDEGILTPEEYRDEMVNLLRWRLESDLGYAITFRIPMRMTNGTALYDMVFATDHPVGEKIMKSLYSKAAKREPLMQQEAVALRMRVRDSQATQPALFDASAEQMPSKNLGVWEPTSSWNPATRPWW